MTLETTLDSIKINSFAGLIALAGVRNLGYAIYLMSQPNTETIPEFTIGIGCLEILLSSVVGVLQHRRFKRLVSTLNRIGYSESAAKLYMDHPCGRQLVKVALARTGHRDEYSELAKKFPLVSYFRGTGTYEDK